MLLPLARQPRQRRLLLTEPDVLTTHLRFDLALCFHQQIMTFTCFANCRISTQVKSQRLTNA